MSLYVEVSPKDRLDAPDPNVTDPAKGPDAPGESPLYVKLRAAYLVGVAAYQAALGPLLDLAAFENRDLGSSRFPEVTITVEDEPFAVVFDAELSTTLFDLYVFFGWDPIRQVEAALRAKSPAAAENPSAGVTASPWPVVLTFFLFARNALALLVRDAVVRIEAMAARRIVTEMSLVSREVSTAWLATFAFRRTRIPVSDEDVTGGVQYRIGNRDVADRLFKAMRAAVAQKFEIEELLQTMAEAKEPARKEGLERVAQGLGKLQDRLTKEVFAVSPVAVLVLDGLARDFDTGEMEDLLGATLWTLQERNDVTAFALDPTVSRAADALPGLDPGVDITADAVATLPLPPLASPEEIAIRAALERDDAAGLPLLHRPVWESLVEAGDIAVGSFEYAVVFQYGRVLASQLAEVAESRERLAALQSRGGKVSAALSLASLALLFVPGGAVLAGSLAALGNVTGLLTMGVSIRNLRENLALLDEELARRLSGPDARTLNGLANLGELARSRREYVETLPGELLQEVLLLGASRQWALVHNALLVQGYWLDMKTLVSDE